MADFSKENVEAGPDPEQPRRCMAAAGMAALVEQLALGKGDRLAVLGHSIQGVLAASALTPHAGPSLMSFDLDPKPASSQEKETAVRLASVSGAHDIAGASHTLLVSPLSDSEMLELLHLLESSPPYAATGGQRRIATVRPIPSWIREQHPACRLGSLEGSSHIRLVQAVGPLPGGDFLSVYKVQTCGALADTPSDATRKGRHQELREDAARELSSKGSPSSVVLNQQEAGSASDLLRIVFFSLAYTVGILCFLILAALVLDSFVDNSVATYITSTIDPRFLGQCALAGLLVLAMVAVVDEGIYQAPTSAGIPSAKALLFQTAAMASVLLGLLLMMAFANNGIGAALTMA